MYPIRSTSSLFTTILILLGSFAWLSMQAQNLPELPPGEGSTSKPYLISSVGHLVWIANQVNRGEELSEKLFEQTADIDMSDTKTWYDGRGWDPIGGFRPINGQISKVGFAGTYDGKGRIIRNIHINRPERLYQALFGYTKGDIRNLTVENAQITGKEYVGGIAAYLFEGNIHNCHVQGGKLYATLYTGGLLGYQAWGSVQYCSANAQVEATDYAGGITAWNNEGIINRCHSSGLIKGTNSLAGGIVGYQYYGSMSQCSSSATVNGIDNVGGIVGRTSHTSVVSSLATGSVRGRANVGGFVGRNESSSINDSYAVGAVEGSEFVGGFAGYNTYNDGQINRCYSTGVVVGTAPYLGGFIGGLTGGSIRASYWDINSSNTTEGVGGASKENAQVYGKTSAEMKQASTFIDWDFDKIWAIRSDFNQGYPTLAWYLSSQTTYKGIATKPLTFSLKGDILYIEQTEGIAQIILCDINGYILHTIQDFDASPLTLSVSDLPSGVYVLRYRLTSGQNLSDKFIR